MRSEQRLAAAIAIRHIARVGITQAQARVDELERALQRTDKIAPVMRAAHCWDDSRPQYLRPRRAAAPSSLFSCLPKRSSGLCDRASANSQSRKAFTPRRCRVRGGQTT